MANFPRVKPLGWALFDILASALMNQLDIDHSKSVNGDDGGSWAGPVEFLDCRLHGTSEVDTTGQITTTATVTGGLVHSTTDVTADDDVIALSAVKGAVLMGAKYQPSSTHFQQVSCDVATPTATLDFTEYDTFFVELYHPGGAQETAILEAITITTAEVDTDKEIKKGARFTVVIYAFGLQSGGAAGTIGMWPASVVGLTASDEVMVNQGTDTLTTYVLEQIGTPGSPKFNVVSVTHGGS